MKQSCVNAGLGVWRDLSGDGWRWAAGQESGSADSEHEARAAAARSVPPAKKPNKKKRREL